MTQQPALVIRSFGKHLQIALLSNNILYEAINFKRQMHFVVGDVVMVEILNNTQARIISLKDRRNLIYRAHESKQKLIASNIEQLVIVIAAVPQFKQDFLDRALLSAEFNNIKPLIVINKTDLAITKTFQAEIMQLYAKELNYSVITIDAINNCNELKLHLQGKQNLLLGQSGVGKSTIINQLVLNANTATKTISKALNRGCQTTTFTALYTVAYAQDEQHNCNNSRFTTSIIDSPGFDQFGLQHLLKSHNDFDITTLFPELRAHQGHCKFRNCQHQHEPDCAIIAAFNLGKINQKRLELLQKSLQLTKHYSYN